MTIPTAPRTHSLYHASEIAARSALRPLPAVGAVLTAIVTFVVVAKLLAGAGTPPVWAFIVAELVFIAVPALWIVTGFATLDDTERPRVWEALGFRRPALIFVAAALVIGASQWLWNLELAVQVARHLHLPSAPDEPLAKLVALPSFALALLSIAIVPALTEEVLFRGVLARALGRRFIPAAAIVVSAIAFAAFHVSLARFVPTFMLGLVYGFMALRARSAVPSMIAHFVNNLCALLVSRGPLHGVITTFVAHEAIVLGTVLAMTGGGILLVARGRA